MAVCKFTVTHAFESEPFNFNKIDRNPLFTSNRLKKPHQFIVEVCNCKDLLLRLLYCEIVEMNNNKEMSDEAVLNALYGILVDDDITEHQTVNTHAQRARRSSFHILFGDELKDAVGEDCKSFASTILNIVIMCC